MTEMTEMTETIVTAILMGRIGIPLITMTLKTLRVQGLHYLNENLQKFGCCHDMPLCFELLPKS